MDIGDIIAISTAVVGIVGTLVTAIINYMSNRSGTKSDLARIKLEEKRNVTDTQLTNVSAATQMLGIGLQQTTFLQNIYSECMQAKKTIDEENSLLKIRIVNMKIAMLTIRSELSEIVMDFRDHLTTDEHKEICNDRDNQLLDQISEKVDKLEMEANK